MGDLGSVHGLGRSPGGGMATYFSILAWRIHLDRGGWQAKVHAVAESRTRLRDYAWGTKMHKTRVHVLKGFSSQRYGLKIHKHTNHVK